MRYVMFVCMCIFSSFLFAQRGDADKKAAMRRLSWMTGTWSGTSTASVNGKTQLTNIRETVTPALDGTLLQISVWATDKDTNTRRQSLAYTSFSVISYNVKDNKYNWTTWRNSGDDFNQTTFTVGTNSFEYITRENGRQVRYKASLGSKGEFLETGEYSTDGTGWEQFITMKLLKTAR